MVDVTEIDCTEESQLLFLVSNQPFHIAKKLNTIPYEILTSISQRVKRVYPMITNL
jgi:alanine racemase